MARDTLFFVLACLLCLLTFVKPLGAEPMGRAVGSVTQAADSPLLDQYPDAYAAYSLRKLRSDYNGPAVRVERSSDGAEQDIGFTDGGSLDTSALTSFVDTGDGKVVRWYSQVEGEADLTPSGRGAPLIVQSGSVVTTEQGKPILYFPPGTVLSSSLNSSFPQDDFSFLAVLDLDESLDYYSQRRFLWFAETGLKHSSETSLFAGPYGDLWNDTGVVGLEDTFVASHSNGLDERTAYINNEEAVRVTDGTNDTSSLGSIKLGYDDDESSNRFTGHIGEVIVYPQVGENGYLGRYDNINSHWSVGPTDYNPEAILPQTLGYQVTLYNWLETISEEDVTIPTGETFEADISSLTDDQKADLWLKLKGASANKPTTGEPGWYVLDNGDGKGIEATGEVRLMFEPDSGPGNPPRSWENEPAYLYQLDIPGTGGGQGNPYYKMPELGRRSMVTAIVDLMMFDDAKAEGSAGWFDMIGKAFLGMAESYRWAGEVLPSDEQEAFEKGMEFILDHQIARGPRAVNTNMDIFMLHGAADFYIATDDPTRKQKCVQLVKRALFGYTDGALETNHKVFKSGGGKDGGVFSSAGFVMEGDQPEIFYGGESKLHLMGAYMAVYDRETDTVPSDWKFLEEVLRRVQEWRTYQWFHNPDPDYFARGSGSGFTSRTSAPVPAGQAAYKWKLASWADVFDEGVSTLRDGYKGKRVLPQIGEMENQISSKTSSLTDAVSQYDSKQADSWGGWSPWTKPTPYLPPEGWYSRLDSLLQNDDPLTYPPSARDGMTFNKTFGGPPLGESWWSYKDTDANGTEWGFFAEAMPSQGVYGGYYGGKIETFWTDEVGYVLSNRHYKAGNPGWADMDFWAVHHVWGKDESNSRFTTAWLRGWDLQRSVTFNTTESPPSITVNNPFNDANANKSGEENDDVLQGDVNVENKIEALPDGVRVTHTVTSDETDEVNELWATLPFMIGENNAEQDIQDASLSYWDGSSWVAMPEDQDSDGIPEFVSTQHLRFERPVGNSVFYAYVDFAQTKDVRLSTQQFTDTYQTSMTVRPVHIDLHGDPGTTKTLSASKSVTYTIQTTNPTTEEESSASQKIFLQKGGNLVSTTIVPDPPAMDSVFAGLQSEIRVVKNETGERYRPDENINTIGQWNSEEAYRVYAESDVTLSIKGDSLDPSSIQLDRGWNWVPYFPSFPLPVEEAVSAISEDLVLMKDEAGRAYSPENGIDVLELMEPGEGYMVYVRQSTSLTYPEDGD